jgi:transmembrane sensor
MVMDEFEFDRLIELYQKGLLNGKKKRLVEDWLNSTDQDIEISFSDEDQLRLKNKILHEIKQGGTTGLPQQAHKTVIWWRGIYKVAAAIVLIAVVTYTIWSYVVTRLVDNKILTANSTGDITKVFLSDGTLVWLKNHSTLTYPSDLSGKTRSVTLQGEALFEVAKDASHPFVIRCGDLTTTVLGTSFNIKSRKDSIEVIVLTGTVSLTTIHDTRGVVVEPSGKVVYDGRQRSISRVIPVDDEKVLAVRGTEYSMNFEDVRMSEVIPRIKKKFGVGISTADPRLENCKITADFSDQSLEKTLSMLSQALQFEFEIDENHVYLSGKGCD